MATVQKGSKINFYKMVSVKPVATSEMKTAGNEQETTTAIQNQTVAINNLGGTLNSFAKVLTDLKKVAIIDLEREQERNKKNFKAKFAEEKGTRKVFKGLLNAVSGVTGGFLENILGFIGELLKFYIGTKVLKWLSNPENLEKVKSILSVMMKIGKFIFDWAKFGITNTIDGLYNLLSDDTSWWQKILGFGQAVVGISSIVLGLRYLKNPTKIVTDIARAIKALIGFARGGGGRMPRGRMGRAGGMLMGGAKVLAGTVITYAVLEGVFTASAADGTLDAQRDKGGKLPGEEGYDKTTKGQYKPTNVEPEQKALGGVLKKMAKGGWINGPQSGYPVSMDGGRSTSFIGHGREYVARRSDGGAFVVPFDTPATKRNKGLTNQRIKEAKKGGYKLPGFADGGYLDQVKSRDATQGPNANKMIFLHWSAGHRTNTNPVNGNGYHTFIGANGQPVSRGKYGTSYPSHTYNRNGTYAAGIGVSGMSTSSEENYSSWGSQAITPGQYQGMAKEAAGLALNWGWKPQHITDKRVRTHSEEYRDYPQWYRRHVSSDYRWDLNRLYAGDKKNTGGDKIRAMIKQQMGILGGNRTSDPNKSDGQDQEFHEGRNGAGTPQPRGLVSNFLGAIDAMTGNRTDFDGMGTGSPVSSPTGGSTGKEKREVLKADTSVKVGNLPENPTRKQAFDHIYKLAKKVGGTKYPEIVAAQAMHETGYLVNPNSVYFASNKTNPFGQTGDRGYGTIPRKNSSVGWTLYPNLETAVRDHIKLWHDVNNHPQNYNAHDSALKGIAAVAPAYSPDADPANIALGYTVDAYSKGMVRALKEGGFDPKTKKKGAAPEMQGQDPAPPGRVTPDDREMDGNTPGQQSREKPKNLISGLLSGPPVRPREDPISSFAGVPVGDGDLFQHPNANNSSGELFQRSLKRYSAEDLNLKKNEDITMQAMASATAANARVAQAQAQAEAQVSQTISAAQSSAGGRQPQFIPTGGKQKKTSAALLNSYSNPIRTIL